LEIQSHITVRQDLKASISAKLQSRYIEWVFGAVCLSGWLVWFSFSQLCPDSLLQQFHETLMITAHQKMRDYLLDRERINAAVQSALLAMGIFTFVLSSRRIRDLIFGSEAQLRLSSIGVLTCMVSFTVGAALGLTIVSAARHDYLGFIIEWQLVLAGEPPWGGTSLNAYGPLFNIFAFLSELNPLAPKIFFSCTWIALSVWLIGLFVRNNLSQFCVWIGSAFLLANPAFWHQIPWNGQFDITVAATCLISIILIIRGHEISAGVALAIGFLLKFYPLAMLPFLMINHHSIRLRLTISFGVTCAIGLLLSFLVWGPSTFYPLFFASNRPSSMLSVFRFLRGTYSPLGLFYNTPNVDFLSLPAMFLFVGLAFVGCYYSKKMSTIPACLIGMLTTFTFYKVGHAHFLEVACLLTVLWFAVDNTAFRLNPSLSAAAGAYFAWIGLTETLYLLGRALVPYPWSLIRDMAGLPTACLACWFIIEIFRRQVELPSSATAT